MLEKYFVEHCAPTLATLKTANLFSYNYDSEEELLKNFEYWKGQFSQKGVEIDVLKKDHGVALIYVFRRDRLQNDLLRQGVKEFLAGYGYGSVAVDSAIATLKSRLKDYNEFPHEVGLFLGYPLEDVVGFVANGGENSKLTGCWKVYNNENEAKKLFAKFNKCRMVYSRLWNNGERDVMQLTVAS